MKRLISIVLSIGIIAWILGLSGGNPNPQTGDDNHTNRSIHER